MPSCSCRNKIRTIEERLLFLEGLLVKGNLCLDGDLVISGKIIDPQGNSLISNADAPEPKSGSLPRSTGPLPRSTGPVQGSNTCQFTIEYKGLQSKDDLLDCLAKMFKPLNGSFTKSSSGGTFILPANVAIFITYFRNPKVSGELDINVDSKSGKLTITGFARKDDQTPFSDSDCTQVKAIFDTLINNRCYRKD